MSYLWSHHTSLGGRKGGPHMAYGLTNCWTTLSQIQQYNSFSSPNSFVMMPVVLRHYQCCWIRLGICKHTARTSSCCSHQTTMQCRNKVWSFIYTIRSTLYRLSMFPKMRAKIVFLSFSANSLQTNLMVPGRCAGWVGHNHVHWCTVLLHSISLLLLLQVFNSFLMWEFSCGA